MNTYKVVYIGIGGIERCTTIEAYTPYEAREEFDKGNIAKKCYNAMMNYQVEITD